jgi:AcrR family transcriptional regulator
MARRRLNRRRVVEKAVQLADEARDARAVTLSALAAALEIRSPSLYNHVDGIDDLRQALALYGLEELIGRMRMAVAGRVGREALVAMARAYRDFAQEHPGIYPLIIRAPEPDEAELVALAQELLQMFLLVLASLGLEGDEALHAVRGLRALLHGFVALEVAGGFKMALPQEESFRWLVDTYLDGLERAS